MTDAELISLAIKARKNSYSPYSGFKVGAALLCGDGRVYTGCNIENAAYSETVCAERVAFFNAVMQGSRDFKKIAIVGGKNEPDFNVAPCGACRQVMAEFCGGDFEIITGTPENIRVDRLSELLPCSFTKEDIR